jgi:hypothetical protein
MPLDNPAPCVYFSFTPPRGAPGDLGLAPNPPSNPSHHFMAATNREKLYRVSSSNHGIFSMPINQMIIIIKK